MNRIRFFTMVSLCVGAFLPMSGLAQYYLPITADLDIIPMTQPCTSGVICSNGLFKYSEMGIGVDFEIPYANTGNHQIIDGTAQYLTWVTDYDASDWYNRQASIVHWDANLSTSAAGSTQLNSWFPDETVLDPDVVQLGDNLFSVYYSVIYNGFGVPAYSFPGNGSALGTDDYKVRFEQFTNTNPPVPVNNWSIEVDASLYAKNPNLDVSLYGDIAMVWEEQSSAGGAANYIYAKAYDAGSGLYGPQMQFDPAVFGYERFYNPDVACATLSADAVDPGEYPVYITFMGEDNGDLDLLVYYTTIADIQSGVAPIPANLSVVHNMPLQATLDVSDYIEDYLSRPRISSHPRINCALGINQDQFNIVVPTLSSSFTYGTNISSFTMNGPFGSAFVQVDHTQAPPSSVDLDCSVNYEPCNSVNQDGYEIVWNNDLFGIWALYSSNAPLVNSICTSGGVSGFHEQTILRKPITWAGGTINSNYSIVPQNACCYTYSPSVAYDPAVVLVAGSLGDVFYGYHYDPIHAQFTFYKTQPYTSTNLKWANREQSLVDDEAETLLRFEGNNKWLVSMPIGVWDYQVFDATGRLVRSGNETIEGVELGLTLDLAGESAGIYTLNAVSKTGRSFSLKIPSFE